jgi:hypothetical protein
MQILLLIVKNSPQKELEENIEATNGLNSPDAFALITRKSAQEGSN